MKISARQYALSLLESIQGKSDKEAKAVIKDFVSVLAAHRDLGRGEEIAAAFAAAWDEAHGELSAEVTSVRPLPSAAKELIRHFLAKRTGAKSVSLSEVSDKGLLGGFVLRYRSQVIDGSLKAVAAGLKEKISA